MDEGGRGTEEIQQGYGKWAMRCVSGRWREIQDGRETDGCGDGSAQAKRTWVDRLATEGGREEIQWLISGNSLSPERKVIRRRRGGRRWEVG